jgi:serine/threonine protein phosphatase PrpC
MSVYSVSKRGKRPQNEDKHNIIININNEDKTIQPINFYSVYDGHGGKAISTYLSQNFPKYFIKKAVQYPLTGKYISSVYKNIVKDLDTNYTKQSTQCGSTCLVAIEYQHNNSKYVDILNTGDSRCVICVDNRAVAKTMDHKPNWPQEKERIQKLGGKIIYDGYDWRIGDLSVSRAFGDKDAAPYVTAKPDIFRHKIKKSDRFMILACDGFWDVFDNQDAINYVLETCYDLKKGKKKNIKFNIAKMLAEAALAKGSTDNITIIVVFFN